MARKMKGFSDLTRSNTMPCSTMTHSAPGTFGKFSAPSTFRKSSAPGTIKCSLCSFYLPTQVDYRITSLVRWPDHLRMGLVPPLLLWEVFQCSTFPLGMDWVLVSQIMASHSGIWAESSSTWSLALVKCVMGSCTP